MTSLKPSGAQATASPEGYVAASVEVAAAPERVFRALASTEIVNWWVRPGVFDTREWTGEVRVGGRWRGAGVFKGRPYVLEGDFLEVDAPRALAHTWERAGAPGPSTTVSYRLDPYDGGTRVRLRHSGFTSREACAETAVGWQTSLNRLAELLAADASNPRG